MSSIEFKLHRKQLLAFQCPARERLYGGSAGGGKSHLARIEAITFCLLIPGLNVYVFRRHWHDLKKNHIEGEQGFRSLLAPLIATGDAEMFEKEVCFANSSRIFFCHAQYDRDVHNFLGAEFHFLILEEATQFSEFAIRYLRSRVRLPQALRDKIPAQYRNSFPRILYTSNPGGPSHSMFKDNFVNALPKYTGDPAQIIVAPKDEGGFTRAFIPAVLADNPSLNAEEYAATLAGLKNPTLVRAYLEGDWNIHAGSFFSCFGDKHLCDPFKIPEHWHRYMGFDWGYTSPFCAIWMAVSSGKDDIGNESIYPKDSVVVYREWQDKGLSNVEIGKGLVLRSSHETYVSAAADGQIFTANGGPSINEGIMEGGFTLFNPADKDRISGWQEILRRLLAPDRPLLYIFKSCQELITAIEAAQVSPTTENDLDTTGNDHALDALRYAVKERLRANIQTKQNPYALKAVLSVGDYIKQVKSKTPSVQL